ncbi:MAG: PEP-CTERM sorting domain-containing protein [Gammaproteobacteria bacterium]
MNNKFVRVALGIFATAIFAASSSASLLVNGGFEDTPIVGAEEPGAGTGWTSYGAAFRVQQTIVDGVICDPVSCAGAYDGTVALKIFGDSGAYQDFAAVEGDSFSGGAFAINPLNADQLVGTQIAATALVFLDASGAFISDVVSNLLDSNSTPDEWIELAVSGVAPAGTATVRFQVFTTGGGGGAPRFDGAYFDAAAPVPVPAAIWLMGSAMIGMIGLRRKNAA